MVKRSQLNMAIPPEVLARLKERAEQEGVSMSALVLRAIRDLLDRDLSAPSTAELSIEERLRLLEERVRDLSP
jgi:hypothetical protein